MGIRCRITQPSYRHTQPNQQYPIHMTTGTIVDVGLPLGEGGIEDWESWLEPMNPADRPDGGTAKKRAAAPTPGSQVEDDGTDEHEKSLDEVRADLIVAASLSLDERSDEGWHVQTGLMTVKYAKEYVTAETGERNPKWVTQVLIANLSE